MEYATGNSAKSLIISEILDDVGKESATVFDYGCGNGQQWNNAVRDHENISYIGYEPDGEQAKKAKQVLPERASIYTGDAPPNSVKADYVVSFSVFEHVADRKSYIQNVDNSLANDGIAYLNYDDGHFRNYLDLNKPSDWPYQLKAWVHSLIGPVFSKINDPRRYQKRVDSTELESLIDESELEIVDVKYNNISDLKGLSGKIPDGLQEDYTEIWVNFEQELNNLLQGIKGAETNGDDCVLWDVALSRTVVLTKR